MIGRTLNAVLDDPNVDSIAMINASLMGELAASVAKEIAAVAVHTDKPIFMAWSARDEVNSGAYALLDAAKVPHYKSPVRCGRALAALSWYAEALRRAEALRTETVTAISSGEARAMLAGRREDVTEYAAKQVLAHYGIGITREELATSREQALAIARAHRLSGRAQSAVARHSAQDRSEGGAPWPAADADAGAAYDEILRNAKAYKAGARIEGVLVQEMVTGGIEAILGVTNDKLFGPAVMFGLGGIFAEVLKDVAFRIAPVTKSVALDMIAEIKGYPVLTGARGAAHADIDALADAIVRLSALALDLKDHVAELDINPLFVFARGKGVKAGDALIKPLDNKARLSKCDTCQLGTPMQLHIRPPKCRQLCDEVRRFIQKEVEPRSRWIEEHDEIPAELVQKARELGLFGLTIPEQYGGIGLDLAGKCAIEEEMGKTNYGFATLIGNHTGISSTGIVALGNEAQKKQYLPRMASGEWIGCFALTEPQAGSDPAAMRTTAVKKGDR